MNTQHIFRTPRGDNDLAMVSLKDLDLRTIKAKVTDAVVAYYAHSQAWTFKGGDALVVQGPGNRVIIFFRVGNQVDRLTGYQGIQGIFDNPPVWVAEALKC